MKTTAIFLAAGLLPGWVCAAPLEGSGNDECASQAPALDVAFLFRDRAERVKDDVSDYDCLTFVSEGAAIYGQILIPSGLYGANRPCVLMFHGFAGFATFDDVGHALCRAGCVVVIPHHRGAWGSEGKYLISNCIQDAVNLVKYVRSQSFCRKYSIDPGAVFLIGHSMGGNTVLTAAGMTDGVRGIVMLDPCDIGSMTLSSKPSDIRDFLLRNGLSVLRTEGIDAVFGDVEKHAKEFSFPNAALRLRKTSLFVIDGTWGIDEDGSLINKFYSFAQQNKGIPICWRRTYQGKHGLMGTRVQMARDIADFMLKAL